MEAGKHRGRRKTTRRLRKRWCFAVARLLVAHKLIYSIVGQHCSLTVGRGLPGARGEVYSNGGPSSGSWPVVLLQTPVTVNEQNVCARYLKERGKSQARKMRRMRLKSVVGAHGYCTCS